MRLFIAAAASAFMLTGCYQTTDTIDPDSEILADAEAPLAGGFGEANEDLPETKAAETLAISAIYDAHPTRMLPVVLSREVQVVAGLNYRFRIGMGGGGMDVKKTYDVAIYRDLDGKMEVTSLAEIK